MLHQHYHVTTPLIDEIYEVDLYNIKKYPEYYVFQLSYFTQEDKGNYTLKMQPVIYA